MTNKERLINEFCGLTAIDSLSLKERDIADRLTAILAEMGVAPAEDGSAAVTGSTAGNVSGCLRGDPALPAIVLTSHMDTVSPGIGKKAVRDGDIVKSGGDTILGADDLSGVVCILEAMRELMEEDAAAGSRKIPHGDVWAVFTTAEEIGLVGAYQFDYTATGAKLAIVLDSEGSPGNVVIKAPSHKRLNIEITGLAAHAGVAPERGISAIRIAARAIDRMKLGRIDFETTANIGVIEGGKATNIICDKVTIKAECRSGDADKLEAQLEHMKECFTEAAAFYGGKAAVEVLREYSAFSMAKDDPAILLVSEALRANGVEPNLVASGGGSDANVINAAGIPAVNMGSGMYEVHSVNEYMDSNDAMSAVAVLKSIIRSGGKLK